MSAPEIRHATLLQRGAKDVYLEDIGFKESSAAKIRQFIGADAIERSKVSPKAVITFTAGIPMTGGTNHRLNLRKGTEITLTWVGGDNVRHEMWGITQDADETDPKDGEHRISITMDAVVVSPR